MKPQQSIFRRARWDSERLRSLATLLGAGLAPVQALAVLQRQFPGEASALGRMSRALRWGESLGGALSRAGVLSDSALVVVQVAESAGQLEPALRQIAAGAEQQCRRISAFRAKLWLPWAVLAIALLVGALLRLQAANANLSGVLLQLGMSLGLVTLVTGLLLHLLELDRLQWLSWGWRWGLRRSRVYILAYEQAFFGLLFWPLNGGSDCVRALDATVNLLHCSDYQGSVRRAQACVQRGESLAAALCNAGLVLSVETTQLLDSAEQAGRIAPALEHQLGILQQRLKLATQALFEWLPRLYYLLILAVSIRFLSA